MKPSGRLNATALSACLLVPCLMARAAEPNYPANPAPLKAGTFIELPLGAVKPRGWLRDALRVQADGATGHLDEIWPSLKNSAWRNDPEGEGWERGPYYLDGLVPLAYLLDDPRLIAKVESWIEPILGSARPDGWFGPKKNTDRWPLAVAMKVLTQYHEATGDERVIPLLTDYFHHLHKAGPDWPDNEWRGVRAMENVVTAFWLYRRTGDKTLIEVADSIHDHSFDWTGYFIDFPYKHKVLGRGNKFGSMVSDSAGNQVFYGHPSHVVNIAMAVKHPGVWYQRSGDDKHAGASFTGIDNLDQYHGQVGGRFSGDEHLAGTRPTQGTELCAIVEYMFSLEQLMAVFGRPELGDRLEMLAYNGVPGAQRADCWTHQYDQQSNQVLCSIAQREWTTNGDTSNLYGLEPNFGCCTANKHQGWPKFVSHMWMSTADGGLAAIAYGPNQVHAKVANDVAVTIVQRTEYPFDGQIELTVTTGEPVAFPLHLRIPAWTTEVDLVAAGTPIEAKPGTFAVVNRTWNSGDVVTVSMPMKPRAERRFNDSVSIYRGPLAYALRVGAKYNALVRHHDRWPLVDWEVVPTTPWNYGLSLDLNQLDQAIRVERLPISEVPFDPEHPPVVLHVPADEVSDWALYRNSAGDPPQSPTQARASRPIRLIPYGSAELRITEFPLCEKPATGRRGGS